MALSNAFIASLLLLVLGSHLVGSHAHAMRETHYLGRGGLSHIMSSIECAAACQERCSKSWKPKMCHRACGTCLRKVQLRPSWYFG